jgi:epoxyqueuosine reductase
MDSKRLKVAIALYARELGFDDCRFTTAASPESTRHFQDWLSSESHGEMGWMARNASKRGDLQQVLPAARSVIVLALNYGHGRLPKAKSDAAGIVARYARFSDYHDVIGEKLELLARFVDTSAGGDTRSLGYVDTGPILERDLAQRAGLGFAGKHTNLISRKLGNWFFIAEIITTAEIDPDSPERNRCGSCSRCITACPTQAITSPFHLDARRCISYLTIELKGTIPIHLRPLIGNRIFGCDDCLEACPWNRFAQEAHLMETHARSDLGEPDLLELLALDEAGFKVRFRGTPILRTKRRGFLRNVCVALGNVGDSKALPGLLYACEETDPLIREHAAWAVEQIRGREKKEPLSMH